MADFIPTKKRVLVYFHTHWDREWYRTRVEFDFRLVKVVDDILEKLKNKDLPCFYFDGQVSAITDYLKYRPENKNLVKNLIEENRLFIGPFYCSTDSFLVSVQSFMANLDLGIEYSKKMGCNDFVGYCADTFGHSRSLTEIFKYYDFIGGIFWRGLGNLPQCFEWSGLKSVYLRQGYFHDYLNSNLSYEDKAKLIENQLQKIDDNTQEILLLPLGADHLKVADNITKQIDEINKYLCKYKLKISNPFEYIKSVKPTKKISGELRDNSRNFILSGILSSRIDLKIKNSSSQWNLLRIAEPLNALCYYKNLTKNNYQPQINIAKKELIKNHAHDSIYGCSIDAVHNAMLRRFQIADETSATVIEEIINELSSDTDNINIINLSNHKFSGLCELKTDKKIKNAQLLKKEYTTEKNLYLNPNLIPVTEDFKTFYTYLVKAENIAPFSVSDLKLKKHNSDLKITKSSIENSKIALKINNNQIELNDKTTNTMYYNFINFIDYADVGDSYNFAPIKNDKGIKAEIINSKTEIKGDLRAVLKIILRLEIPEKTVKNARSKSTNVHYIKLFVTLDTESNLLKFRANFDNKSKNHILKVAFNFNSQIDKTVSDDMIGTVERKFDANYNIGNFVPAAKGVELKTNTAPMQTFVETKGAAIITKGLNEYEVKENRLEVTLLRSTGIISNPKNPARGTPAGPPISTENLYGLGNNDCEFAIIFSKDIEEIKANQQAYYGAAITFFGNIASQKLTKYNNLLNADYNEKFRLRTFENNRIIEVI